MMSSYLKTSVFARPHEYDKSPFSKSPPGLESVFENLRLRWPKTPAMCGRYQCHCSVAVFGEKHLRFRKYPATCGRGLRPRRSTRSGGYFPKRRFFPPYLKKICVHTPFLNRMCGRVSLEPTILDKIVETLNYKLTIPPPPTPCNVVCLPLLFRPTL